MYPNHVFDQVAPLGKGPVAELACEGSLTSVRAHVVLEVVRGVGQVAAPVEGAFEDSTPLRCTLVYH